MVAAQAAPSFNIDSLSDTSTLVKFRKDAAIFLRDSEDRFLEKIKSVVIVGGVGIRRIDNTRKNAEASRRRSSIGNMLTPTGLEPAEPAFMPDNSEVVQHDERAAQFFYSKCQELGIQLIMVPNEVTRRGTIGSASGRRMLTLSLVAFLS